MAKKQYVDGFLLAIPQKNFEKYKKIAATCGKIWMEHGALSYAECVAEDVKKGKLTSFPRAVQLKRGEVVVFSWITYRSRKDRDRVNKKVMADPRMKPMMEGIEAMPFDGKRMIYGGFETFVNI
jgi:uncharacterized protein YbaA (DUF1428 family)